MRALLDACVLYPTVMRELLLGAAGAGLYTPLWSPRILEEWARAVARNIPADAALARTEIALARAAFPEAEIAPAPDTEAALALPDPADTHVLAAAIDGHADILVTDNRADFPTRTLARHGLMDITVKARGDLHIDQHHTTEDVGIVLGQAVRKALGDMRGITRYADVHLPMDETLTRCAIDISGRPHLVFRVSFTQAKIGAFDTELVREFFQAFAQHSAITLHVENLYGDNSHHIAETCFKALARALRSALAIDPRQPDAVPSTKGSLGEA